MNFKLKLKIAGKWDIIQFVAETQIDGLNTAINIIANEYPTYV